MSSLSDGIYKTYEEHMKTLRAWYVGYGIGGPLLYITQPTFAKAVVEHGTVRTVGLLFLLGVLLQVVLALLNKWVNWGNYYYEAHPDVTRGKIYNACQSISKQAWLDILVDLLTLVFFAWATVLVFVAVGESAAVS